MAFRKNQPHPLVQKYPRIFGFLTILMGWAFFYYSIAEPILHAKVGEIIKLNGKAGTAGALFIIFGLVVVILGPGFMKLNQSPLVNSTKLAMIVGGFFGIIGIIAMELTKHYLRGKGYII